MQPTVVYSEDSIEFKIQEFYTKYESIDRTVRSISTATAEQVTAAIADVKKADRLLNVIDRKLSFYRGEALQVYALAQQIRVVNLQRFETIMPQVVTMVLKNLIGARIHNLMIDIGYCRGILEAYTPEDEYWSSTAASSRSAQSLMPAKHISSALADTRPMDPAIKETLRAIATEIHAALAHGDECMQRARQAHESERAEVRRYAQYCTEQREQASVPPVVGMNMLALIAQVKEPGKSDEQKSELYRAMKFAIKTASVEDVKALSEFLEFNYKDLGFSLSEPKSFQLLKGMLETMVPFF